MSGLEALGAACAIFQTISFAREATTLCYSFYSSSPVAYDRLQANTDSTRNAVARMHVQFERLQNAAVSSETTELLGVLQRVDQIAQELIVEVSYVLEKRQPGSIVASGRTQIRYLRKKSAISSLVDSLDGAQQTCLVLLSRHQM